MRKRKTAMPEKLGNAVVMDCFYDLWVGFCSNRPYTSLTLQE